MEAFYDSDEDVCWGPITLREVKRDLRRPLPTFSNIDRRRTIGFNSPPQKIEEKEEPFVEDMQEMIEDVSRISMKSEYFTPNETMKSELNFVDKVSHILNESTNLESNCASFATAADKTTLDATPINLLDNLKSIISPKKNIIPLNDNNLDNTNLDVTNFGGVVRHSCMIDNFHATLLDASDSSDEAFHRTLDNIIEQLDEDLNEKINEDLNETINEDVRYNGMQAKYEDISEVYDTSLQIDESFDSKHISIASSSDETIEKSEPPVSDDSFDACKGKSEIYENYSFNDTLEEMERALQMGLDYSMTSPQDAKKPQINESLIKQETHLESHLYHVDSLYSKAPLKLCEESLDNLIKPLIKPESIKKTKLRTPNNYKFNNIISPVSAYIKAPKDCIPAPLNAFKLPQKRSPHRLNQRNALSFKTIQSPVAVYIKNTPTVPLQQNVQKKELPRLTPKSLLASSGDNKATFKAIYNLPEVCYKPAKKVVAQKHVRKLPGYIEKLIPNKAEVVKHVGRIGNNVAASVSVHRKLMDNDLTVLDDSSLGCSSQDISVLTSKQATIE